MTIPVSLGCLLCFILPPQIFKAEGQGLFNMYLEFLIRRSRFKSIESMRNSKLAATAIFSVLHSIIMFGFLKNSTKNFWVTSFSIKPANPEGDDDDQNRCQRIHGKSTCRKYFFQVNSRHSTLMWNLRFGWFWICFRRTGIEENSKICIWIQRDQSFTKYSGDMENPLEDSSSVDQKI